MTTLTSQLRLDDAALEPGKPVVAHIRHAVQPVPGIIAKLNKRTVVITLDTSAHSMDGRVLYPAGGTVSLPRMPRLANDAPAEGYVILAPTAPANATTLKPGALETILAQRTRLEALQAEANKLQAEINLGESQVTSAMETGAKPPPGFFVEVAVTTRQSVRPEWKAEAMTLAKQVGFDPSSYEATVRARTEPSISVTKSLVIKRT